MCHPDDASMRLRHLALSLLVLASCESTSVRDTECARIRELAGPKRTWSYAKPVPLGSIAWKDPEIRAAVDRLERGVPDCVEIGRHGDEVTLQCAKTLAQLCGF